MSNMANRCPSCGSPHINDNTCTSCGTALKVNIVKLVSDLEVNATTEHIEYLLQQAASSYERGQFGSAIRNLQEARRGSTDQKEIASINNFINLVGEKLKAA